jgi:hypothetical protein
MLTFDTEPSSNILDGKPKDISSILVFSLLMTSNGHAPYLATLTPSIGSLKVYTTYLYGLLGYSQFWLHLSS